jgi:chemotaxis protein methyltransferase CheR
MTTVLISNEEYALWSKYIHDVSGITLDNSKKYLIETRFGELLKEFSASTYSELYRKVTADVTNRMRRKVIDTITTNETSFFRDTSPFEMLQHKIIPDLIDKRSKSGFNKVPIRIWSAACSTGQEIYSIAITLHELLKDMNKYDIRLFGSDISDKALAQASYAKFTKLEIERGLGIDKLNRFFVMENNLYKVRDEIRGLATFKNMNLLEPFSFPVPFDIIFCRNVAIYFSEADRIKLFRNLGKVLARDGYLIIGSTESISGICPEFESKRHLRSVFYQFKTT